jgi:hypothetical protein
MGGGELDRTSAEKEQVAQYGLVVLEEKDSLELRCQVVNRMVGGGDWTGPARRRSKRPSTASSS